MQDGIFGIKCCISWKWCSIDTTSTDHNCKRKLLLWACHAVDVLMTLLHHSSVAAEQCSWCLQQFYFNVACALLTLSCNTADSQLYCCRQSCLIIIYAFCVRYVCQILRCCRLSCSWHSHNWMIFNVCICTYSVYCVWIKLSGLLSSCFNY